MADHCFCAKNLAGAGLKGQSTLVKTHRNLMFTQLTNKQQLKQHGNKFY